MQSEIIFRVLAGVVLVTMVVISASFRRKADQEGGALKATSGTLPLIALRVLALLALLPVIGYFINPDWVSWARVSLPDWVRWVGAVVAVACMPLLYWVLASIGNNISPVQVTRQNHQLVTHGPYRYIRHPLYSVGLVFMLALSLVTALWWLAAGMLIGFVGLWLRTSKEEAWLIETFGDAYRNYMQRTGRFFPKVG
jgi:protein-S-isoprenylcysteine O-methyltransferase Ste14